MNEKVRKIQKHFPEGCPVQLSRLFTAQRYPGKRATNELFSAKPSALELAMSAEGLSFSYLHKSTLLG